MTTIEWTDRTWNPTRGCARVSSGCEHCYAERIARRFDRPGGSYEGLTTSNGRWNGQIRLVPEKLEEPLRWRTPSRVFVDSMSDLFHPGVSDEYIETVFQVMGLARKHQFQVLTKRPERMRALLQSCEFQDRPATLRTPRLPLWGPIVADGRYGRLPWPLPNVWLGVSVEDQKTADERVPLLLETPAAIRFLSCEPLLAPLDLGWLWASPHRPAIDWVIVGGESGPGARRCNEGVGSVDRGAVPGVGYAVLREAARSALGTLVHGARSRTGADPTEWPPDLRVRRFPVS